MSFESNLWSTPQQANGNPAAFKKACRHFQKGHCNLGERCNFLHTGEQQTGAATGTTETGMQNLLQQPGQGQGQAQQYQQQYQQRQMMQGQQQGQRQPGAPQQYQQGFPNQMFAGGFGAPPQSQYGMPQHYDPYGANAATSYDQSYGAAQYGGGDGYAAYGQAPGSMGPRLRCRHFAKGYCKLGESCGFAHSGSAGDLNRCRHWATKGECSLGDQCKFAHTGTPGDLRLDQYLAMGGEFSKHPRIRCRHWGKGNCNLGSGCGFAHTGRRGDEADSAGPAMGMSAEAPMGMNGGGGAPTITCRHWSKGRCNLGTACGFAHPEGEAGGSSVDASEGIAAAAAIAAQSGDV